MAAMADGPLDAGAEGYAVLSVVFAVGGVIVDTTMTARMQLATAEKIRGRVLAAKSVSSAPPRVPSAGHYSAGCPRSSESATLWRSAGSSPRW